MRRPGSCFQQLWTSKLANSIFARSYWAGAARTSSRFARQSSIPYATTTAATTTTHAVTAITARSASAARAACAPVFTRASTATFPSCATEGAIPTPATSTTYTSTSFSCHDDEVVVGNYSIHCIGKHQVWAIIVGISQAEIIPTVDGCEPIPFTHSYCSRLNTEYNNEYSDVEEYIIHNKPPSARLLFKRHPTQLDNASTEGLKECRTCDESPFGRVG